MKTAGGDLLAQFFARLYVGPYLEATGDAVGGRRSRLKLPPRDRFARVGGYMHDVARVHMQRK